MGTDSAAPIAEERPILENPWPALIVAFVTIGLAFILTVWFAVLVDGWAIWRTVLLGPGILAAGLAVYIRPRSPAVLTIAAMAAFLASFAIEVPVTSHPAPEGDALPATAEDSSLSARAVNLVVDEGQYYSPMVVARFTDAEAATPASVSTMGSVSTSTQIDEPFTALIQWGDGKSSTGLISRTPGPDRLVKASHPFLDEGFYQGRVTILAHHGRHVSVGFNTRVSVWDSGRLLLRILAVLAVAGAGVVLLPRALQYAVVSVLILFHFIGILSAITNVDPEPWLSAQLWTYVYRPYLQFIYMNNAYHYYAPDPGPSSLLWFRVEYTAPDAKPGSEPPTVARWIQVTSLTDDDDALDADGTPFRLRVEYTRRLSLGESVNQHVEVSPTAFARLELVRRVQGRAINFDPTLPANMQYLEPPAVTKLWVKSYVRHVAKTWPHPPQHPDWVVHRIRLYLVHQEILGPDQFATPSKDNPQGGQHPNAVWNFRPFYEGEFLANGQMTEDCYTQVPGAEPGAYEEHRDPLLYWLIPIYRTLKPEKQKELVQHPDRIYPLKPTDWEIYNGLKLHAGDTPWDQQQP